MSDKARSKVEIFFAKSSPAQVDTNERIPVIVVSDYVELGRLTALRFIEWIRENPEGVVALPTGKTPEYFIKWFHYYRSNWSRERRSGILGEIGFTQPRPPTCKGLHFVQIDEFFPIDPGHERSFRNYIERFYIRGFGFDPSRAILMDTFSMPGSLRHDETCANLEQLFAGDRVNFGLRFSQTSDARESLQQQVIRHFDGFCQQYESGIRSKGGIGFFLGGIGPDGHVAFNVRGSSHFSATRLTTLNYESMAAAAPDLGGIETVRKKAVITIGLETITWNQNAVAIIFAAGESKAGVIAQALENDPTIDSPASALQKLKQARFYLTTGAASKISARQMLLLRAQPPSEREMTRAVLDSALSAPSFKLKDIGSAIARTAKLPALKSCCQIRGKTAAELATDARNGLIAKIRRGLEIPGSQRFLHTGPHHDDIELAYFPLVHHLVRSTRNSNTFCYLTSGFTSVTNEYVLERLSWLESFVNSGRLLAEISLDELRNPLLQSREIHGYLNAIADRNRDDQNLFASARLCRHLLQQPRITSVTKLIRYVGSVVQTIRSLYPGALDPLPVQQIKSWIREWEAESVWAHFGLGTDSIHHLRLQFYTGEIFPDDPQFARDVIPIVNLLEKTRPTIVTLALDPEGSGPDTHYKCLMAMRSALTAYVRKHNIDDLTIWGYRNVWSRFHPADADCIVPVSLNSFAVLDRMFNTCFVSQKSASFPSHELDGTFSELAQKVWVDQFKDLTRLLGRSVFYEDAHPMMRRAYGAIYMKIMKFSDFLSETASLEELQRSKTFLRETEDVQKSNG